MLYLFQKRQIRHQRIVSRAYYKFKNVHHVKKCFPKNPTQQKLYMGRGFGRGAKSVAIVTHAQVKTAKKAPRGLRITRKKRRRMYRREGEAENPDTMMDTGDNQKPSKKGNNKPKSVEQQIASVDFQTLVPRGKKLKHLRRQLVSTVKNIRRRNHQKQEARAKSEVKQLEKKMKQRKNLQELKAAAAKAGKKQ